MTWQGLRRKQLPLPLIGMVLGLGMAALLMLGAVVGGASIGVWMVPFFAMFCVFGLVVGLA